MALTNITAPSLFVKYEAKARPEYVDVKTGLPTELSGEALHDARKNDTVITETQFVLRQLPDVEVQANNYSPGNLVDIMI